MNSTDTIASHQTFGQLLQQQCSVIYFHGYQTSQYQKEITYYKFIRSSEFPFGLGLVDLLTFPPV